MRLKIFRSGSEHILKVSLRRNALSVVQTLFQRQHETARFLTRTDCPRAGSPLTSDARHPDFFISTAALLQAVEHRARIRHANSRKFASLG